MNYIEEEPHYLLDSNIISEIIKPQPNFNVLKKIAEHSSDCAICSPVWEELKFGVYIMEDGLNKKYLERYSTTNHFIYYIYLTLFILN